MHLIQAIQRNAQVSPDTTALQFGERSRSWREIAERVAKLAGALRSHGVKPGDRVAMLGLNSDRYYEYYYAIPWAGAVLVPLNIRWSLQELLYSLDDSGAAVLFIDDAFGEMGQTLMSRSNRIRLAIYTGEREAPTGTLAYEQLVADAEPIAAHDGNCESMAGIFYTGGTTGFPKGVMLSHRNIWTSSMSGLVETELARNGTCTLHAAPMFHLACAMPMWMSTLAGARQVIVPGFDADHVLAEMQRCAVTDTVLVPTMIALLLASDALGDTDLGSLRAIIYGASPMPEGTLRAAMEKLPGVNFRQAYGQTELAPLCSILGPEYHVLDGPWPASCAPPDDPLTARQSKSAMPTAGRYRLVKLGKSRSRAPIP
ncbi:AMP-binding protein [Kineobactrum salinum]|uniref:AMP-binding protein n=1 Tax=Kineobactrum salinum TaxID=2708301 RepID=UPI0022B29D96|nr:AMP-binding protein [Kineobactrum salinum]